MPPGLATNRRTMLAVEDVGALEARLRLPITAVGPVLEVEFPAAGVRRDIAHGLNAVPHGYVVILSSEGTIYAVDVASWSPTLAFFKASANYTRARIAFYTLQEGVINVIAP